MGCSQDTSRAQEGEDTRREPRREQAGGQVTGNRGQGKGWGHRCGVMGNSAPSLKSHAACRRAP